MSIRKATRPAMAVILALGVTAWACGGGDSESVGGPLAPATGTAPVPATAAGNNGLPDAEVRDVASGATQTVRALAPADRPTLFWFWAPH